MLLKVLTGLGYGNDAGVRASIGYEIACGIEGDDSPLPPIELRPLGGLDPEANAEECDVAIVGSGAGGSVAATLLAEAGLDVVVLEAGPYMDRGSYPEEPMAALAALYRDGGLTIAEGRPAIPTPVGRAVGGTTVINSGTCFRAPDDVLARWRARERDRVGHRAVTRLRAGRGDAARHPGEPGDDGAQRADPDGGGRCHGPQPPPALPQRRALLAVQLVPAGLPAGREAGRPRLLSATSRGGRSTGTGRSGGGRDRLQRRARHRNPRPLRAGLASERGAHPRARER